MGPQNDSFDDSGPREVSLFGLIRGAGLGPVTSLAIGGATLIVAIAIGTFVAVMMFRDRAIDTSKQQLESKVLLLTQHFEQSLTEFTEIQRDLLKELEPLTALPRDQFIRGVSNWQTHVILDAKLSGHADAAGINVWGPDGELLNTSSQWPVPERSIAGRPSFEAIKSDPAAAAPVNLVRSPLTGGWVISFARRLSSPTGEFLGLMTRGLKPKDIEAFFDSVETDTDSSIALLHSDGTLMAR